MAEGENRSPEEVLASTPEDISVKRFQGGAIVVWQHLPGGFEKELDIRLGKDPEDESWYVSTKIKTVTAGHEEGDDSDPDTAVNFFLKENGVEVIMRNRGQEHSLEETVKLAKQGLDLLDAYINAPVQARLKYRERVLDDTEGVDYDNFFSGTGIHEDMYRVSKELRGMGLTTELSDPQPVEKYRFMQYVLQQPALSIKRT